MQDLLNEYRHKEKLKKNPKLLTKYLIGQKSFIVSKIDNWNADKVFDSICTNKSEMSELSKSISPNKRNRRLFLSEERG